MVESRIVQGTGVSVNSRNRQASLKIQRAMENAIKQAHKEGITDPNIIRDRMRKAHIAAKSDFNAAIREEKILDRMEQN